MSAVPRVGGVDRDRDDRSRADGGPMASHAYPEPGDGHPVATDGHPVLGDVSVAGWDEDATPVLAVGPRSLTLRRNGSRPTDAAYAHLRVAGRSLELRDLVVRDAAPGTVELEVREATSRARLWDLADRLRSGTAVADGHDDPGGIPARGHYTDAARGERVDWIRRATGAALPTLDEMSIDVRTLPGNIENVVGSVEIPVGLAGPLLFDGTHVQGHVTAPLATTEGALVASTTRGARALTLAGGVRTHVLRQRMSRAPVFEFADARTAARFGRWVQAHEEEIAEVAARPSSHAELVELQPIQIGRAVSVRFGYETGDAAGQNMTTACTWHACQWIIAAVAAVPGLEPRGFRIEGNASSDKKVSHLSVLAGRGTRVTADALLPREVVVDVLKTTPETMAAAVHSAMEHGIHSGMVGHSVNAANLVAAIFAATGQDIACVHESSVALFSVEATDEGLYASILLPALVVGTVGGGTSLPHQRDYLEMLGCAGGGRVRRLAEVVAGFALALDLSTAAAVSGGQFADAHERLGRNKPVRWFTRADLSPRFLTPLVAASSGTPGLTVDAVEELPPVRGTSVLSDTTGQDVRNKLVGLVRLRLALREGAEDRGPLDVVVKSKPLDREVALTAAKVASLCGGRLAELYPRWRDDTGFADVHTRELGAYRHADPAMRRIMPRLHGVFEDPAREAHVLVLEDLTDTALADDGPGGHRWSAGELDAAIAGIAGVHAAWLGREDELAALPWLGWRPDAARMAEMRELWRALVDHNAREYPQWLDALSLPRVHTAIDTIDAWWAELEGLPRTLVHHDFNPRNIGLRPDGRLVAFDWELATVHVPQRDVAELLASTLPSDVTRERLDHHVEAHRAAIEAATGRPLDPVVWRRGFRLALLDFAVTRVQLYMMAHTQRRYAFLDDLVATVGRLLELTDDGARDHDATTPAWD